MKSNRVVDLMIWLNYCEINGHIHSAEIARKQLAEAMAPVVTAHPFALAS